MDQQEPMRTFGGPNARPFKRIAVEHHVCYQDPGPLIEGTHYTRQVYTLTFRGERPSGLLGYNPVFRGSGSRGVVCKYVFSVCSRISWSRALFTLSPRGQKGLLHTDRVEALYFTS